VIRAIPEPVGGWGIGCAFLQEISDEEIQSLLTKEADPWTYRPGHLWRAG
jgi:hypothetical protein